MMTLVLPQSSMPMPRVRRKPVPSVDSSTGPVLALDIVARYPTPDPDDPFAPLSVLRSRSSVLQGRVESTAFPILIQPPSLSEIHSSSSSKDVLEPLKLPLRVNTPKESHYRRRSQSIAIFSPSPIPSNAIIHGSLPSLVAPNSASGSGNLSTCPSSASRGRMSNIFLPKKASSTSMNSCGDQRRRRKVSVASISSPMRHNDHPLSARSSLDFRNAPTYIPSVDAGYYSQPETLSTFALPKAAGLVVRNKRSALVSCVARPSIPMLSSLASPLVRYPPSTESETSSYVNVSSPSQSYNDHDSSNSTTSSLASHSHDHSLPADLSSAFPASSQEWAPPTSTQLNRAAVLPLVASSGLRVPFGSVFARTRTIVIFIRHFWCPLCQDYMSSLASLMPHDANVVVISNGSHVLIDKYKAIFNVGFDMYVDPGMEVYRALGMGSMKDVKSESHVHPSGGYVRRGTMSGIAMVVLRALRVGMPVWEKGGEIGQLGGEFILGPGMNCSWAHRMQTAKGHAPVADVLEAGGVGIPRSSLPVSDRTQRRECLLQAGSGVRASVSWSVDDRRKSMTIEEQWIRNGYMQPKCVVDEREKDATVEELEDEVVMFK